MLRFGVGCQDRPRDHINGFAPRRARAQSAPQAVDGSFARADGHVDPALGHVIQAPAEAGTRVPGVFQVPGVGRPAVFGPAFDDDKCGSTKRSLQGALLTLGLVLAVFFHGWIDRFLTCPPPIDRSRQDSALGRPAAPSRQRVLLPPRVRRRNSRAASASPQLQRASSRLPSSRARRYVRAPARLGMTRGWRIESAGPRFF